MYWYNGVAVALVSFSPPTIQTCRVDLDAPRDALALVAWARCLVFLSPTLGDQL